MADTNAPFPQDDEARPVVWTPEDASRFLTSAIYEAQRPLAEALKQRPVTTKVMGMIVGILVFAAIIIASILSSQLSRSESRLDKAIVDRDSANSQKLEFQSRAEVLEARLAAAQELQNRLKIEADTMRTSAEDLKKTRTDLQRFRRQNELLKSQISGLEMEKMALSRQLDAVRAMAMDDGGDEAAEPSTSSEPAETAGDETPPADTEAEETGAAGTAEPETGEPPAIVEAPPVAAPASAPQPTETVGALPSSATPAAPEAIPATTAASESSAETAEPTPSTPTEEAIAIQEEVVEEIIIVDEPVETETPTEEARPHPAPAAEDKAASSDEVVAAPAEPVSEPSGEAPAVEEEAVATEAAPEPADDTAAKPQQVESEELVIVEDAVVVTVTPSGPIDPNTVEAATPVELSPVATPSQKTEEAELTITSNPPTLYEASQLFEETAEQYGVSLANAVPAGEADKAPTEDAASEAIPQLLLNVAPESEPVEEAVPTEEAIASPDEEADASPDEGEKPSS